MNHSSTPPFVLLAYQSIPPGYGGLIHTPNDNDVLCGRGGRINSHEGNIQFRKFINAYKEDYLSKRAGKVIKARIAACIVSKIRSLMPSGRFLKTDADTGLWVEIGDEKAKRKTGQALREDASKFRQLQKGGGTEEMKTPKRHGTPMKKATPNIANTNSGHHKLNHCVNIISSNDCIMPPRQTSQCKGHMIPANLDTPASKHASMLVTSHQPELLCKKSHQHINTPLPRDEAPSVDLSNIQPGIFSDDDKTIDSFTLKVVMEMNDSTETNTLKNINPDSSYHTFARMQNTPAHKPYVHVSVDSVSLKIGQPSCNNMINPNRQEGDLSMTMSKLAIKKDGISAPTQDNTGIRSEWRQQMMQVQAWRKKKNKLLADMFDATDCDSAPVETEKVTRFGKDVTGRTEKVRQRQILMRNDNKGHNENKSCSEPIIRKISPTTLLQKQSTPPPMDINRSRTSLSTNLSWRDLLSLGSDSLTAFSGIDDDKNWLKSFKTMMSISTGGTTLSDLTPDMVSLKHSNRKRVKIIETACC